jgi:hypothetical protein
MVLDCDDPLSVCELFARLISTEQHVENHRSCHFGTGSRSVNAAKKGRFSRPGASAQYLPAPSPPLTPRRPTPSLRMWVAVVRVVVILLLIEPHVHLLKAINSYRRDWSPHEQLDKLHVKEPYHRKENYHPTGGSGIHITTTR